MVVDVYDGMCRHDDAFWASLIVLTSVLFPVPLRAQSPYPSIGGEWSFFFFGRGGAGSLGMEVLFE